MKCVVCEKDSGKGKTCSSTCRSKLRRSVAPSVANATVTPSVATVEPTCDIGVAGLTRQQLKVAIDSYPGDTWKDSPEYKELIRRLHAMTVEELEADGYWIPSWKVSAGAAVMANTPACAQAGAKP